MSAKSNISDNITKLERKLAKIQAAERKKLINENILYLEKNGDIGYETVRTISSPHAPHEVPMPPGVAVDREAFHGSPGPTPAGANSYTETPIAQENGQQFAPSPTDSGPKNDSAPSTQATIAEGLSSTEVQ